MQRFQHLLVDLGLNGEDAGVLRWADHLATLAGASRLTVVHAWENADIPNGLREKYPWLVAPGAEMLEGRAKEALTEGLTPVWQARAELRLLEGDRLKSILRVARDEAVDLVLTPRLVPVPGAEHYSARLARKAPCAVFCVEPERAAQYKKVLVPVDFSVHAERALDFGCALARAGGLDTVDVLRCFGIPYGQHRSTLSRDEFRAEYERFETERLEAFVGLQAPADVRLEPSVVENATAAYGIARFAKDAETDVIVLGSRGRHAASAILLGSTTETVLQEVSASVLIIKPKGTGLSLLESLLAD